MKRYKKVFFKSKRKRHKAVLFRSKSKYFKFRFSKLFLYMRCEDIVYFFQSCKIGQFFMIHFIYDVFLQFLYFSKILDFVYFTGSFCNLKKYLLKQYVLSSVFYFHYSTLILPPTRSGPRLAEALINSNLCIFAMVTNEPIFLRWKCLGQLGWLDLAWRRVLQEYTTDWAGETIFEETCLIKQFLQVPAGGRFFGFYPKKFDKKTYSRFSRKLTWDTFFPEKSDSLRRLTFLFLPHGFPVFWAAEEFAFMHPLFSIYENNATYRLRKLYRVRIYHFWKKYFTKISNRIKYGGLGLFRVGVHSFKRVSGDREEVFYTVRAQGKQVGKRGDFTLNRSFESLQSLILWEYLLESRVVERAKVRKKALRLPVEERAKMRKQLKVVRARRKKKKERLAFEKSWEFPEALKAEVGEALKGSPRVVRDEMLKQLSKSSLIGRGELIRILKSPTVMRGEKARMGRIVARLRPAAKDEMRKILMVSVKAGKKDMMRKKGITPLDVEARLYRNWRGLSRVVRDEIRRMQLSDSSKTAKLITKIYSSPKGVQIVINNLAVSRVGRVKKSKPPTIYTDSSEKTLPKLWGKEPFLFHVNFLRVAAFYGKIYDLKRKGVK